jgi:penicillin-binding protein 1A
VVVVNARRRPLVLTLLLGVALLALASTLAGGTVAVALYARAARTLPPVPPFEEMAPRGMTVLRANDGQVIAEFYEERRLDLAFEDIPAGLILAFLAAEDERFFEHSGLDLRGVARAVVTNIKAGGFVEGASTITQQLAKSVLGRPEGFGQDAELSLLQKAREAIYARRLEDVYTKEQILLLYLNRIFLGHHSYGVRAAAQNYFRKDLRDLDLTEMALLAALPQSPTRLNPLRSPARARDRLTHVLEQMLRNGFIDRAERDAAAAAPLVVYPLADPFRDGVPYFVRAVVGALRNGALATGAAAERDNEGSTAGPDAALPDAWRAHDLRIDTTADIAAHRAAEAALDRGLRALDRQQGWRGPLLRLPPERQAEFFERVAAELRGRRPRVGSLWPALVTGVDAEGVDVQLTEALVGRIPSHGLRWAGPYEEGKKVSFGRALKDPRTALAPGDVVLVAVEAPAAPPGREKGAARGKGKDARRRKGRDAAPAPETDEVPSVDARDGGPLALSLAQEPQVEGAVVAIDPWTGAVPVVHGGWDFDRSEVDRVRAQRQSGSAIKPAIYSLAYDLGLPPSTLLSGAPYREGDYAPTAAQGKDDLVVWDALAESENNVSLRIMNYVQARAGTDGIQRWFAALGLDRPVQGYTAEVLGVDQTPLGLTRMMATFARGGRIVQPRLLRRVTDRAGRVWLRPDAFQDPMNGPIDALDALHRAVAAPAPQAIPETTAWIIAANLRDVFRRGTASKEAKALRMPAAGKTGTLEYDVWFAGFTRQLAATVWIGADRRERPLGSGGRKAQVYGANTALPVWRDFLNAALVGVAPEEPLGPPPAGVTVVSVDPATGALAAGEGGRPIPHREGTEPLAAAPQAPDGSGGAPEVLQTEF